MSSANNRLKRPKPRKRKFPALVYDTVAALLPFINPFGCGEEYDGHPIFSISDKIKARYARHIRGQTVDVKACKAYHGGKFKARSVYNAIYAREKLYCTSSNKGGYALDYLDIDDHFDFQRDKKEATAALVSFIGPDSFFVANDGRLYHKVRYGDGRDDYNATVQAYHSACRLWMAGKGFHAECDRAKCTMALGNTNGVLGRAPLYDWNYPTMDRFKAAPCLPLDWFARQTQRLLNDTDVATAKAQLAKIEALKKAEKGEILSMPSPPASGRSRKASSISSLPLTEDDYALAPDIVRNYKDTSFHLMMFARNLGLANRVKLTAKDIQVYLAILWFARKYPQDNHGLPFAFIKAIWRRFAERGVTGRCPNNERLSALWRIAQEHGCIKVFNSNYWFYDPEDNRKGQCMQWELSDALHAIGGEREHTILADVLKPVPVIRPTRLPAPTNRPDWYLHPDIEAKIRASTYEAA